MTKELETGGPAFPFKTDIPRAVDIHGVGHVEANSLLVAVGMTTRTYAAIHLRVAMSEHDWLNDMIRESQRQELAKAAMQGAVCGAGWTDEDIREAIGLADAMLARQENHHD